MNLNDADSKSWLGLAGSVCVVTGAGSGIGAGTAREFAALGASVAVLDRDGDAASRIASQIRQTGGKALDVMADVQSEAEVASAAEKIRRELGPTRVLVNNAAVVGYVGSLMDGDMQRWNQTLGVNLTGALICARMFGRQMIDAGQGGSIVNVASICGRLPLTGGGGYSVSKAGLIMLTRMLALELAEHHIRCNAVSPGLVHTPATELAYSDAKVAEARRNMIPLGRIANPDDLAGVVAFLASSRSGYINGEDFLVDGGLSQSLLALIPQPAKPMQTH
jgi:NAD(P)-dependent dehydrogenase (short-subunit alcohol dehydrogenase family)